MNTSESIVALLTKSGPSSISEIALTLNLTKADIRYHLNLLMSSKQVTKSGQNEITNGRGRPAAKYEKKEVLTPGNLEEILKIFTNYILTSSSLTQIVDEIWHHEIQSSAPSTSPINRINYVLQFLDRLGVQAVWIAGKSGPQVKILQNLYEKDNQQPYFSVVDSLIKKAVNYAVNG